MTDPTIGRLVYLLEQGAKNAAINLSRDMANKLAGGMRTVMQEQNAHLIWQSTFDDQAAELEQTL